MKKKKETKVLRSYKGRKLTKSTSDVETSVLVVKSTPDRKLDLRSPDEKRRWVDLPDEEGE